MRYIYIFFLIAIFLFACKKEEKPCINSDWLNQPLTNSAIHMEWAGQVEVTTDSCGKYSFFINNQLIFQDSIPLETKIFSVGKWDSYKITSFCHIPDSNGNSFPIKVRQRYEDCSNRE